MDETSRQVGAAVDPVVPDPVELALVEVDAAISLVVLGVAVRVSLCALAGAERVAVAGASRAQTAGVAFRVRRDGVGAETLVIGPRIGPTAVRSR
ncbi:MAG TPA: hypothetical protein VFI28_08925 [Candidatus Limnocylindrales bacterium]|nr:hypothetical protein [Candidatus Limnocylindrales bacterium]